MCRVDCDAKPPAWSPDGTHLACVSDEETVCVWDVHRRRRRCRSGQAVSLPRRRRLRRLRRRRLRRHRRRRRRRHGDELQRSPRMLKWAREQDPHCPWDVWT
jgi:hypothetical protein